MANRLHKESRQAGPVRQAWQLPPDRMVAVGPFARGKALLRGRRGLLAMARQVVSVTTMRHTPRANRLDLD